MKPIYIPIFGDKKGMNIIRISGLKFRGFHGVYPDEKVKGNDFQLDITILTYDMQANQSDRIEDAIDYSQIAAIALQETVTPVNLLEHLGYKIANSVLLSHSIIEEVDVKVTKLKPPMDMDLKEVSVETKLKR